MVEVSYVTVYNCDGPACVSAHDDADESLIGSGWFAVSFDQSLGESESHFCSAACLAQWADELAFVEANG